MYLNRFRFVRVFLSAIARLDSLSSSSANRVLQLTIFTFIQIDRFKSESFPYSNSLLYRWSGIVYDIDAVVTATAAATFRLIQFAFGTHFAQFKHSM